MDSLIPQNFQGYIQQATKLIGEAKTAMKLVKNLSIAGLEAPLAAVFASALPPVFTLIGQYRQYIPVSIPSLPGTGGIGGIGNLSIPNVGLGDLNNNAVNTLGLKNL